MAEREVKQWITVNGNHIPIYDNIININRTLYHGAPKQEYIDDIFNPNTPIHMSDGLHGKGLYFTPHSSEALSYGYSKGGNKSFVGCVKLDPSKTKIISEPELLKRVRALNIAVTFENCDNYMKKYGYNVLYSPSDDYYIVKDKSVLMRVK